MSYFQDAMHSWELPRRMQIVWRLDKLPTATEHVKSVLSIDSPSSPRVVDIELVYRKLRRVAEGHADLGNLNRRELKTGIWAVFKSFQDGLPPLIENSNFFQTFLQALSDLKSPRTASALILNFLEEYPRKSNGFDQVCSELSLALTSADPRLVEMRDRVKRFGLLSRKGPTIIADQILDGEGSLVDLLNQSYLSGTRARQGIVSAVHSEICGYLITGLSRNALNYKQLSRVLDFCASNDSGKDLRIPSQRTELANSLLTPFLSASPEADLRELIKKFVLDYFGDPRTKKAKWQGIQDGPRSVITRWLVQDTFEDFCRIVDLTQEEDSDADRQWPYRRAFWLAYFKKGVISDAWLVLGSTISRRAQRQLSIEASNYAKLTGGGKPTHAVLILRIQNYIFVEWSHVGSYRMWHMNDQTAPKLYSPTYHRNDLINRPLVENRHSSAESGTWQRRLADVIEGRTGIRLLKFDYMAGV